MRETRRVPVALDTPKGAKILGWGGGTVAEPPISAPEGNRTKYYNGREIF